MAAPSYTKDTTRISDASAAWVESTAAGWIAISGITGGETDDYIQDVSCNSCKVTVGVGLLLADAGAGGVTIPTDGAWLIWAKWDATACLDTYAGDGIRMCVGDALNTFRWTTVAGSDTYPYGMGWQRLAMGDPAQVTTTSVGAPGATRRYFGWAYDCPSTVPSKGQPYKADACDYGRCEARFNDGEVGNPCTFAGFAAYDDTAANRWGLLWPTSGGYLWHGLITIGYSTDCYFKDSNRVIFIQADKKVPRRFNRIVNNRVGNTFTLDNITFINLGSVSRGDFNVANDAPLAWTGCQFRGMGTFTFDGNSDLTSNTWNACWTINPGGGTFTFNRFESTASVWGALYVTSAADMALVTGGVFQGCARGVVLRGADTEFDFVDVGFDGCTYDVVNEVGHITSEWGPDYYTVATVVYGANGQVAQTFAGDGYTSKKVMAYLSKTGSPTGSVYAKIYAHTGSFGTTGTPTGSALATSDAFDISTLSTSAFTQVVFNFASPYTLSAGSNWCVVIEYTSGSAGTQLNVGTDAFNSGHAGNFASKMTGSWVADATRDMIHIVREASEDIEISASGSNVSTYLSPYGGTVTIVSSVSLTIDGFVTGSDVVVYAAGTETVLDDAQEVAGTSWVYSYAAADAGDEIDVGIFLSGYRPEYVRGYTLSADNATLPVAQTIDRDYVP